MKKQLNNAYQKFTAVLPMELLEATLPTIILILAALFIAYKYVDPAPPKKIIISTSTQGSNYRAFATVYREYLKKEGITLEIRDSKGDIENLQKLKNPDSGIDIAFIQDGVASSEGAGNLLSLGSLYYEPAWIFCRCQHEVTHLSELKGKRIAVGLAGGGSHALAMKLLDSSGINNKNSRLLAISNEKAARAIHRGEIDAAIFVDVPNSAIVMEVSHDPAIHLISMDEAEAFTRLFPYLHHLVLPEGSLDLEKNIPAHDVELLAPTATLVARSNLHPALVYLMLKTIAQVHSGSGILNKERDFPADKDTDFPLSDQAESFYKSGLPFLDKYLPFWAATFVNRMLIVLIPLLALLIPLTKIIPTIYIWLIKMKLYRYYGELRFLETQLRSKVNLQDSKEYLDKLNEIDDKVSELLLPVAFSQHLYELKGHIELVRIKLQRQIPQS